MMDIKELKVDGWERVVQFTDQEIGFQSIISLHDTTLGPGCGGCRIRAYASHEEALEDVTRLSKGMTYKNALGGIPFGGGKAVIVADHRTDKSDEILKAFGRAVEFMGGSYYTAADSGVGTEDLAVVRTETKYVAGFNENGVGGNPSPFTARGVWRGIQAAAKHKFGDMNLDGQTVSILGIGAVGMALAELLNKDGAKLIVADINEKAVAYAEETFGAKAMSIKDIVSVPVDIFSPCALGGVINEDTIDLLNAKVAAGAANNQLLRPEMDTRLADCGILYAPDYVINAAGVISIGLEILGEWTKDGLESRIDRIGDTLTTIFARASEEGRPTGEIADQMALEVINAGR